MKPAREDDDVENIAIIVMGAVIIMLVFIIAYFTWVS